MLSLFKILIKYKEEENNFYLVCVWYMCVYVCTCAKAHLWKSQDNLGCESLPSTCVSRVSFTPRCPAGWLTELLGVVSPPMCEHCKGSCKLSVRFMWLLGIHTLVPTLA